MSRRFAAFPLVYLISAGELTDENFDVRSPRLLETIRRAVVAKISLVQIREKRLSARKLFELTVQAAALTRDSETLLLINDRADVAFAASADGVHLTANSLAAKIIRQNFPADFIVAVSTHTLAEAKRAQTENADFAVFSPIFYTASKAEYVEPQGVETLREVCRALPDFPIVALGGIDKGNFALALDAGARGVAAIRFLNQPDKLTETVEKIRNYAAAIRNQTE